MNGLTVYYLKIHRFFLIKPRIHYVKMHYTPGSKRTPSKPVQHVLGPHFSYVWPHEQGNRLVSNIITSLLKMRKHYVHMENNQRFLHVSDVADALITVLEHGVTDTINIASGQSVQIKELASIIAKR